MKFGIRVHVAVHRNSMVNANQKTAILRRFTNGISSRVIERTNIRVLFLDYPGCVIENLGIARAVIKTMEMICNLSHFSLLGAATG